MCCSVRCNMCCSVLYFSWFQRLGVWSCCDSLCLVIGMHIYSYTYVCICIHMHTNKSPGWVKREEDHSNTLQRTETHCSTLQHTAAHCSTLQHTATNCTTLHQRWRIESHRPFKHIVQHCNTLQHTATHCGHICTNIFQHCNTLQHTVGIYIPMYFNIATNCNALQAYRDVGGWGRYPHCRYPFFTFSVSNPFFGWICTK